MEDIAGLGAMTGLSTVAGLGVMAGLSKRRGPGRWFSWRPTGEVDRHGDTVAPEGWRLDAYRDNPVVLWAHDYGEPAIGRAEAVWSDGRALRARLEFAPTEFAGQVERLYRQGLPAGRLRRLPAPAVRGGGATPVNGAFLGIRFLEQELLEISAVPVPANGGALLAEETLGFDRGAGRGGTRAGRGGGAAARAAGVMVLSESGFAGLKDCQDWGASITEWFPS